MIVSSNVLNVSEQTAGRFRCTFNYVFDDGREINLKPSSVGADYQAVCDARTANVFAGAIKSDAQEAFGLGLKTAYKYATKGNIYYEYLYDGYFDADPISSYDKINTIVQEFIDAGLTRAQIVAFTGLTDAEAQALQSKYQTLKAASATIEDYRVLKGNI